MRNDVITTNAAASLKTSQCSNLYSIFRPVSMLALSVICWLGFVACSGGGSPSNADQAADSTNPTNPASPNTRNDQPDPPPAGQSRAGEIYTVMIPTESGFEYAFTVFEPRTLVGGETYPLVLEGHGYSGNRQTADNAIIGRLRDEGYGVISIDQRGHGDSTGTIRVMDPDFEGRDLVRILDWVEGDLIAGEGLEWAAYGPDLDAGADNLLVGAIGSSYGGGYQHVLNAVDQQKRLDVMVPQITWNNLSYSLNPNNVIKSGWGAVLFGVGNTASNPTFGNANVVPCQNSATDPYICGVFADGFSVNEFPEEAIDFFRYHGPGYFCDADTVATNGGVGTTPLLAPGTPPGGIHVMYWQGWRDNLFNMNEAYANYQCHLGKGGDVRFYTYGFGHNALTTDNANPYQPPAEATATNCGQALSYADAAVAFLNEHLQGDGGADYDNLPSDLCVHLSGDDAILVPDLTVANEANENDANVLRFDFSQVTIVNGGSSTQPLQTITLDLQIPAGETRVVAGIPHLKLDISMDNQLGDPIVFFGLGHNHGDGNQDLMDFQVTPWRAVGTDLEIPMVGVAERINSGETVSLLIFGGHDQYHTTASRAPTTLNISGSIFLPVLDQAPAAAN